MEGGDRVAGRGEKTVRAVRRPEVRLPELAAYDGGELEAEGDYDGLEFADADWAGQSARGARFMDCAVRRCALDETVLGRARFIDSVLSGVRGVGTDLSQASLRDVEVSDARLGGTQLHGAVLGGSWCAAGRSTSRICGRRSCGMSPSRGVCWSRRTSPGRCWSG